MNFGQEFYRNKKQQMKTVKGPAKNDAELSGIVDLLFTVSYSHALMKEYPLVYLSELKAELDGFLIPRSEIINALERLHQNGSIFRIYYKEGAEPVYMYSLTNKGFNIFMRKYYKNYIEILKSILEYIKQKMAQEKIEELNTHNMARDLKHPRLIIDYFLEKLHNAGKLRISRYPNNNWQINEVLYLKKR
ncbi:MAG: hypothetical protein ACM3S2_16100 [Ignavibacteriales bacterium]